MREPSSIRRTDWNRFKATLGKLLRDGVAGAHMGFSECIDTILNLTVLSVYICILCFESSVTLLTLLWMCVRFRWMISTPCLIACVHVYFYLTRGNKDIGWLTDWRVLSVTGRGPAACLPTNAVTALCRRSADKRMTALGLPAPNLIVAAWTRTMVIPLTRAGGSTPFTIQAFRLQIHVDSRFHSLPVDPRGFMTAHAARPTLPRFTCAAVARLIGIGLHTPVCQVRSNVAISMVHAAWITRLTHVLW